MSEHGPPPPGPDLEELVARHVLGWDEERIELMRRDWTGYGDYHFSRDIAAAWQVVEHLRGLGWEVTLKTDLIPPCFEVHLCEWVKGSGAHAEWDIDRYHEISSNESMPHAVCLAALAAVGQAGPGGAE